MPDSFRRFIAFPSVVETGKPTEITLLPLRGKFFFEDGKEYSLFIHPMTRYRALPDGEPDEVIKAKDGCLKFSFTFPHEGEYQIRFITEDLNKPVGHIVPVYALEKDLYPLRPLKGDFHAHSDRSDGRDDPAQVMASFRKNGYDFGIVTDHNRYFGSEEAAEAFEGADVDFTFLRGEEVHAPGRDYPKLHIVNLMSSSSVAKIYVKDRERYDREIAAIEETLPEGDYRNMLARAKWVCDHIHAAGGLAVLPHPFWQPGFDPVYNVAEPLLRTLFASGWFDAYEIVGAMGTHGINLSVAYFNDLRAEGFSMPTVGSSDEHATEGDPERRFGNLFSVVFAASNTREAIYDAVKNSLCAAVERVAGGPEDEYRVCASFRLTSYVRFLVDNYFSRTRLLCEPEGELMAEYLLGVEGAAEALKALRHRTGRFYEAFFGRTDGKFYNIGAYRALYSKYDAVQAGYGVPLRGSRLTDEPKLKSFPGGR